MDKSWMHLNNRLSPEYLKGVGEFLDFAWPRVNKRGLMVCPCLKCNNVLMKTRDDVEADLVINGIVESYTNWHLHGEEIIYANDEVDKECDDEDEDDDDDDDDMIEMIGDAFGQTYNDQVEGGLNDYGLSEPNKEANEYYNLLRDVKQKLYPGCKTFSKLSFIVRLLHIKVMSKWSNKSFTMMLQLFKEALPDGETLPKSYYEAKKVIRELGLHYKKIDACPNDCMLFWKRYEKANSCVKCGASRWKSVDGVNNEEASTSSHKKKLGIKTLRYFPLKPRLQRFFMSSKTAKDMIWHQQKRINDGVLRHPADSKTWKDLDARYPIFGSDARNVRLGLATDGFNPFGSLNVIYSAWPILLVPYNLPPWMCMKEPFSMLSLLIPGPNSPGNDIDVYLQPLVEELKELWDDGVLTYDSYTGHNFVMRAAVLWTINDFPAYGNLSGWSTHGAMACPSCNINTDSLWLKFGGKFSYMGHRRWLTRNHTWRSNRERFNNKTERRVAPIPMTGDDALKQLEGVEQVCFGKLGSKQKIGVKQRGGTKVKGVKVGNKRKHTTKTKSVRTNWKKHSIFFELPYWRTLLIRHNLDVMHIEKNVCETLVHTLLNMEKSKDNANARKDLSDLGIRSELHLKEERKRLVMPAACYTMSSKEKEIFCQLLKDLKVPDGFSSNIARCAQPEQRKIIGMKSHDYHVLMQRLLPIVIRGLLPENVCVAITELSNFFRGLCSKALKIDDLERLETQIAITLCKLEMIFPPSFFVVMVHLTIHLAYEAKVAGPVQYRWNYFVERNMHKLQCYVKNRCYPEGSIAEGYIVEECLTFCSRYMDDIETRFNRLERNYETRDNQVNVDLSVFKQSGRPLGGPTYVQLDQAELNQARLYVLLNCNEVTPYIEEHLNLVKDDCIHKRQFVRWFEQKVTQLYNTGVSQVSEELLSLARGPDRNVTCFKGYVVNGYRFHTKDREEEKKTQNSGVKVIGGVIEYYGVLINIIELHYLGGHRVVLFKCKWWDVYKEGTGFHKDKFGFTSFNFSKTIHGTEPFILACQAEQVFYVQDNCKQGWHVVVKTQPRDFYDMPRAENEDQFVDSIEEPMQEIESQALRVSYDNVDEIIDCRRNDIDDIVVDDH